jgi:hypothetical protein
VKHAALGETRHGHSEDDGEGDYLFFHRCICCLIVDCLIVELLFLALSFKP